MKGKQLIAIDNCNFPLDGDLLNQALTQGTLEMRILGQSRDVVTRCATVNTATGNNLIIVGDLTRRASREGSTRRSNGQNCSSSITTRSRTPRTTGANWSPPR